MKKIINIVIFGLLLLIFGSFMFTFQVRQDQVAFRSTFGGEPKIINEPGLYLKLPWPFQKVFEFDKRVYLEQTDYMQVDSQGSAVMVELYFGWKISDPAKFFESHDGNTPDERVAKAQSDLKAHVEESLEDVLKSKVAGPVYFIPSESSDATDSKLEMAEEEIAKLAKSRAEGMGVSVEFVGFRRVGLPPQGLDEMLNAMVKDWDSKARVSLSEAESKAETIRGESTRKRQEDVETARAQAAASVKATRDKARQNFTEFQKDPLLAEFLIQLDALEKAVKPGATLILDETMGPFPLLQQLDNSLLKTNSTGLVVPPANR